MTLQHGLHVLAFSAAFPQSSTADAKGHMQSHHEPQRTLWECCGNEDSSELLCSQERVSRSTRLNDESPSNACQFQVLEDIIMKEYIDLFLLPVPKKNLRAYRRISQSMGKIMKEYGALEYREFVGDDLNLKGMIPFPKRVPLRSGEVVVAAMIGFRSKAHRNQVNKRVMTDPRVLGLIELMTKNPLTDMKRMSYGGFATIVKA
jgi:uncharacterized protein YbaA (DUF1428 family)